MGFLNRKWPNAAAVSRVIELTRNLSRLSDTELVDSATELRQKTKHPVSKAPDQAGIIAHGVEAVKRVFGFQLHGVQISAIVSAANGYTVEMQTGEGKTVVSALIGYYYAHLGHVHLATTNQYLAARDYETIAPIYSMLGLSSGLISQSQPPAQKRAAYLSDVTFGPGYQFGFDYLLDQTSLRNNDHDRLGMSTILQFHDRSFNDTLLQQGGFHTMIIDEADSVMIDEALTPLVLSGASSNAHDDRPYLLAKKVADQLVEDEDYVLSERKRTIGLTFAGIEKIHCDVDKLRKLNLARPWSKYVENALHVQHLYTRNEHYVTQNGKVKIVDQFTGRIFDDRQWQDGLHQAACAKEGTAIDPPNQVLARVSRQKYFLLYKSLVGLSGTLETVRRELKQVYKTKIKTIPTHKPSKRKFFGTRFFESDEAKLDALLNDVRTRHQNGQPVLIGTRTILQSQACAEKLVAGGLTATVLNGIQDQEEAEIVAAAGQAGNITIATNMAGRGTDIKLDSQATENGGLHVIGFEHNFSRRVDRQLIGRSARQGQPGSAQFFQSLDDELFQDHPAMARRAVQAANKHGECSSPRVANLIRVVQQEKEHQAFKTRQSLMQNDRWLTQVRETFVKETA